MPKAMNIHIRIEGSVRNASLVRFYAWRFAQHFVNKTPNTYYLIYDAEKLLEKFLPAPEHIPQPDKMDILLRCKGWKICASCFTVEHIPRTMLSYMSWGCETCLNDAQVDVSGFGYRLFSHMESATWQLQQIYPTLTRKELWQVLVHYFAQYVFLLQKEKQAWAVLESVFDNVK